MRRLEPGTRAFAWVGLVLCGLAVVGGAVLGVGSAQVMGRPDVDLSEGSRQVVLPADKTYGIYVEDADNSGYTLNCDAEYSEGQQAVLEDPPGNISSSDTEMLDHVFNTGSGKLTITCSASGVEGIRAGPVLNWTAVSLGGLLVVTSGLAGVVMLLAWAGARSRSATLSLPTGVTEVPASVPWGAQQVSQYPAPLIGPPGPPMPDWLPVIVSGAVGGALAGQAALRWVIHVITLPRVWDDPELWAGGEPGDGPSSWDMARSTWTELLPALGVGVLVLLTWGLCARRSRVAAWLSATFAMCLAASTALPV